jgi:hypothetical protein
MLCCVCCRVLAQLRGIVRLSSKTVHSPAGTVSSSRRAATPSCPGRMRGKRFTGRLNCHAAQERVNNRVLEIKSDDQSSRSSPERFVERLRQRRYLKLKRVLSPRLSG